MSLFDALLRDRDPMEERAVTRGSFWRGWAAGESDFGGDSDTGVSVNRHSALGVSAVWACVGLISDSIATLPVDVVTRDSDGTDRPADGARPPWLDVPNPEQTPVDFVFNQVASLLCDGNAFVYNVLDSRGNVVEAWALDPSTVVVRRERQPNGQLKVVYYVSTAEGQQSPVGPFRIVAGPEMFHIMAFQSSANWPRGLAPLEVARRMFGSGIAGQEMGARFFGHGMNAAGVIETPEDMDLEQARELKNDFANANSGIRNMHIPPVLTGGAHFNPIQITPEQSQFIEQRRFSVEEIARFFRVPPFMVGDLAKTTSWGTGVEQQGIGFVTYTLRPWITRLEAAWSRRMLPFDPQTRFRINVHALLRGDQAARSDYYQKQFMVGAITPSQISIAEGRGPITEEGGDVHYYPVAMAPVGSQPIEPIKVPTEDTGEPSGGGSDGAS